jgi:hypothetical protein
LLPVPVVEVDVVVLVAISGGEVVVGLMPGAVVVGKPGAVIEGTGPVSVSGPSPGI